MNAHEQVFVIDFGAGSGKVFSARFDGERLAVEERHRFPNHPLAIGERLYNNIGYLYDEAKKGVLRCVAEDDSPVLSLGLDTWGNDYGLLDRRGELMALPYNYRDTRTLGHEGRFPGAFASVREHYDITGIPYVRTCAYSQLLAHAEWLERSGAARVAAYLMTPDLLSYFFTGEKSCEYVQTSTSGLVEADSGEWSEKVLSTLPFARDAFPALVRPGHDAGPLRDPDLRLEALRATRLCKSATHDTGSAVMSVPDGKDDFIYISCGSWMLMGMPSPRPVLDDRTFGWEYHHQGLPDGRIRIQKGMTGLWILRECLREFRLKRPSLTFADLEAMATRAEPFKGYVDISAPPFALPGDMPGKIRAYCRLTGQSVPEDIPALVRCVYESIALKCRKTAEELDDIGGGDHAKIYLLGGGVKDRLLGSLIADATGKTVLTGSTEASALGNCLVQLVARGRIGGYGEARAVAKRSVESFRREPARTAMWKEASERARNVERLYNELDKEKRA